MNIERFKPDNAFAVAAIWNSLRDRATSCLHDAREITPVELAANRWQPSFVALDNEQVRGFLLVTTTRTGTPRVVAIGTDCPVDPETHDTLCRLLVAALLAWADANGKPEIRFALRPDATDAARWLSELSHETLRTDAHGREVRVAAVDAVVAELPAQVAAIADLPAVADERELPTNPPAPPPPIDLTRFYTAEQLARAQTNGQTCRACEWVKLNDAGNPIVTAITASCRRCGCAGVNLVKGTCPDGLHQREAVAPDTRQEPTDAESKPPLDDGGHLHDRVRTLRQPIAWRG